jgi:hypothetical protein
VLDFACPIWDPAVELLAHGNKLSGSVRDKKLLEWLSNSELGSMSVFYIQSIVKNRE